MLVTRSLPETPDGRVQDLIEAAKAHIHSKVEHPFRVIKQQFGFQKTRSQRQFMAKGTLSYSLLPLKPILSRDSLTNIDIYLSKLQ